jgi:hypothetical protein
MTLFEHVHVYLSASIAWGFLRAKIEIQYKKMEKKQNKKNEVIQEKNKKNTIRR